MDGFTGGGTLDSATWQALGLSLTIAGLGISALLWVRRGPAAGLRGAAWSLIPLAAGLTGTLRLAWDIADSVALWATRLVFSPVVWLGIAVAGVSAVLFGVSGVMRRRGVGTGGKKAAEASGPSGQARPLPRSGSKPAADPEMEDIEAILRKHGIS